MTDTIGVVVRLLRVDPSSVRRWRAERPPQGPPFLRLSDRVVLYDDNDLKERRLCRALSSWRVPLRG
ncbi:hypothetical protein SCOCK_290068 [Actinacidiphila cocklensis]|uniref:Uncharacterized protein n=1 Tax=Actinacidiphila cocklensis TaxID=887465 RepID=A0A9W4DNL2_9ACTN|nr:hypothetical protein SCOCK_290068 [Actinacidiphila cocklensis]